MNRTRMNISNISNIPRRFVPDTHLTCLSSLSLRYKEGSGQDRNIDIFFRSSNYRIFDNGKHQGISKHQHTEVTSLFFLLPTLSDEYSLQSDSWRAREDKLARLRGDCMAALSDLYNSDSLQAALTALYAKLLVIMGQHSSLQWGWRLWRFITN